VKIIQGSSKILEEFHEDLGEDLVDQNSQRKTKNIKTIKDI